MKNSISEVTKSDPCRHCGKTDWCYRLDNGLEVCKRGFEPADGWYKTSKQDKEGSYYYAPEVIKKKRPEKFTKTEYFYTYWNYAQVIKVTRVDPGNGKKKEHSQSTKKGSGWAPGFKADKSKLALYRWLDVEKAITQGERIFIVEGEGVADDLWKIGIAATTGIGGSKKWRSYGDYAGHLRARIKDAGYEPKDLIVICPDRDIPGMSHAEDIAKDFPNAKWCYTSPNEFMWRNLPMSDGIDLGDWIASGATKEMILDAVRDKWDLQVAKKKDNEPDYTKIAEELSGIRELKSELQKEIKQAQIAKKYDIRSAQVRAIADSLEKDENKAYVQAETKRDIAHLFNLRTKKLDVSDYVDAELADEMKNVAREMGVTPESILHCLLPATSTLLNPASRITVRRSTGFKQPFVLFSGLIAESGTRKTPLVDLVTNPLKDLQRGEDEKHDIEKANYEMEWKAWKADKNKDIGNEPQPPAPPREYHLVDATTEAIAQIICQQKYKGVLYLKDELSGFFLSKNAYRGGKGADTEFFLEAYNGNGVKRNRVGDRNSSRYSGLSLLGGIQPDALRKLMGGMKDEQGEWARFLFLSLPNTRHSLPRGEDSEATGFKLSYIIRQMYEAVDKLPDQQLNLTTEAYNRFADYYDFLDEKRYTEMRQGVRAAISKQIGSTIRIAGLLHIINGVRAGQVPCEIGIEVMEAAIKMSAFYIAQIELIYSENVPGQEEVTEFSLMLEAAERKGELKPRDLTKGLFRGITSSMAKAKLEALAEAGYGQITKSGCSIKFILQPNMVDTTSTEDDSTTQATKDGTQPEDEKAILGTKITTELKVGDTVVMTDTQGENPQICEVISVDDGKYTIRTSGGQDVIYDSWDIQTMIDENWLVVHDS